MKNKNLSKIELDNFGRLFGYRDLFNNFIKLFEINELPKIIMLSGNKGIGKFTFIFHFINYILSKSTDNSYDKNKFEINNKNEIYKKILSGVSQNFNYLTCERPLSISVDDVRELKTKLSKAPLNNFPRFNIIDDIETININAANALLKLTEEPSEYDYFILINNNNRNLIETLLSRSIEFKIFLSCKDKTEIFKKINKKFNFDIDFLNDYIEYSTPGNLLKFSNIINEHQITSLNNFDVSVFKLLNAFKKSKNIDYLNFILFITDIKFLKIKKNNDNFLKIFEIKNKISNLFKEYSQFNLNTMTVLSQFKFYLKDVR